MTVLTQSGENTFDPVAVKLPAGEPLGYGNESHAPHNLYSNDGGPDGGPLFDAKTFQGPGVTKPVEGVQYLSPGKYQFHCTLHEHMIGTLTVTPGTPVDRPKVSVAIKGSKLDAVRRSGVLKTKISNSSTTDGVVELEAKLSDTTLADKGRIALAGGDSQNVSLKLSKEGKQALKGLHKAKVKLVGTPAFGKPDSAKKTLK